MKQLRSGDIHNLELDVHIPVSKKLNTIKEKIASEIIDKWYTHFAFLLK